MINPNFPIGTIFNPTLDKYWVELPTSARNKLKGHEKKFLSRKFVDVLDADVLMKLTISLLQDPTEESEEEYEDCCFAGFRQGFNLSDVDTQDLKSDYERQLNVIKGLTPKKRSRYFYYNSPLYQNIIMNNFEERDISPKVNSRLAEIFQKVSESFELKDSTMDSTIEELKNKLNSEHLKIVNYHAAITSEDNDFSPARVEADRCFLSLMLYAIQNKTLIQLAIEGVWTICYLAASVEAFVLFYRLQKDTINTKNYPFLNFSLLHMYEERLNDDDLKDEYLWSLFRQVEEISFNDSNQIPEDVYTQLKKCINNKIYEPDYSQSLKTISLNFKPSIDELLEEELPNGISFPSNLSSLIDDITSFCVIDNATMFEHKSISDYFSVFLGHINSLSKKIKSAKGTLSREDIEHQLTCLHSDAEELGKKPLDNLELLQQISEEVNILKVQATELKQRENDFIKELTEKMQMRFESLKEQIATQRQKDKTDVEGDMIKLLEDENEKQSAEILRLKAALDKHPKKSSPALNNIVPEIDNTFLTLALDGKASLEDMFSHLQLKYPGLIKLSKTAVKSLKSNGMYTNKGRLYTKLSTMLSKDFRDGYEQKGSVSAYEFLTRKELSFQESKTTKCMNVRTFDFGDEKIECNAHLRIGVDNKEQNMLRVYFAIKDGVLHIGNVCRHMPTSSD